MDTDDFLQARKSAELENYTSPLKVDAGHRCGGTAAGFVHKCMLMLYRDA